VAEAAARRADDLPVAAPPEIARELVPKLDALEAAVRSLGAAPGRAAPAVDLQPVLDRLAEVLARPAPVPVPPPAAATELGPVLEKLAEVLARAPAAQAPPQPGRPEVRRVDITAQLQQMQAQVSVLAGAAKAAMQGEGTGKVEAMQVWQQANDVLELLRAIPGVAPKHRRRG